MHTIMLVLAISTGAVAVAAALAFISLLAFAAYVVHKTGDTAALTDVSKLVESTKEIFNFRLRK